MYIFKRYEIFTQAGHSLSPSLFTPSSWRDQGTAVLLDEALNTFNELGQHHTNKYVITQVGPNMNVLLMSFNSKEEYIQFINMLELDIRTVYGYMRKLQMSQPSGNFFYDVFEEASTDVEVNADPSEAKQIFYNVKLSVFSTDLYLDEIEAARKHGGTKVF